MMVGDRFDTDIRAGVLAVCREYQTLAVPNPNVFLKSGSHTLTLPLPLPLPVALTPTPNPRRIPTQGIKSCLLESGSHTLEMADEFPTGKS